MAVTCTTQTALSVGYRTSLVRRTYANERRDSEKQRQNDWVEYQSIIIYFRHMAHKK